MNIKLPYSWIKEYLDTDVSAEELQKHVSLCGPSFERIDDIDGEKVFDIEITSNRIDSVSVYGIAREAHAVLSQFGKKSELKPLSVSKPQEDNTYSLSIVDDNQHARRVLAVVMEIDKPKESPDWLKKRLEMSGIRSLNNIIDVTNYVMLEVGFPTHVFDYDRLKTGKLIFRNAKKGEIYVTLDDKKCELNESDVIIEDGTGRIIDLPGIMGAENSVVTNDTKKIVFFIESDDPKIIRRTSMRLALRTMAASINEKNPDPYLAETAFLRGIELFQNIANGVVKSPLYDVFEKKDNPKAITLTQDFIEKRMGVSLKEGQIEAILTSLGFAVKQENKTFHITPPTFRMYDVTLPEDIVEEVARIYGYHNLPNTLQTPVFIKQPKELEIFFKTQTEIKRLFKHFGLHESMNYSMISKKDIENVQDDVDRYIRLANTISTEIEYMRTFLAPSLLKNVKANIGKKDVLRFFEIAKIYVKRDNDLPDEQYHLSIALNTDYYDLKGVIEALVAELHIENVDYKPVSIPLLIQGVASDLVIQGKNVGSFGQVRLDVARAYGIDIPVYVAEINFTHLIQYYRSLSQYRPINPFARVKLDITIEKKEGKTYADIYKTIQISSNYIHEIEFLGIYQNKLSFRLYFEAADRNITEEEAKAELSIIEKKLTG